MVRLLYWRYASHKKNLEARLEWLEYYLKKQLIMVFLVFGGYGQAVSDTTNTFAIFNLPKLEWYFQK